MPDNTKDSDKKKIPIENNNKKERAVNPLAVRPEGVNVTIVSVDKVVKQMAKIFGF